MPFFVLVRAMLVVQINKSMTFFSRAKGYSTQVRTLARLLWVRTARSDIGCPFGFFVWMFDITSFFTRQAAFFLDHPPTRRS
jgi:hypothetical protein